MMKPIHYAIAAIAYLPIAYGMMTIGAVLTLGGSPTGQVIGGGILLSIVAIPATVFYYADELRLGA